MSDPTTTYDYEIGRDKGYEEGYEAGLTAKQELVDYLKGQIEYLDKLIKILKGKS